MSELITLARPYAVAAYQQAKETGTSDRWQAMLNFLNVVLDDPQIRKAATNPRVNKDAFLSALLDLAQDQLDDGGRNLVRLLVQNHRLDLVPPICALFSQYRAEDEGYIDVTVDTAYPLDDEEEQQIAAIVEKLLQRRARLIVREDRSLIGGVVIRAGDRVIDSSIRGQLQRLEKSLCH
jgi:F-type H+-transporting ATPase subunit delta